MNRQSNQSPQNFSDRIISCLNDEEVDLYVLTMHYQNNGDLGYFAASDQKRIREIFSVLIRDTHKHRELLERILDLERGKH